MLKSQQFESYLKTMTNKVNSLDLLLWFSVVLLLCLYISAILFRPLLPDETRYMTAAWEMHLRGDWLAPLTINFRPYHHKPPLLFWLINLIWSILGTSRWAGTIPVFLSSTAFILLTRKFAVMLFPNNDRINKIVPVFITGSIPFLIYSLLIMFDITLTVFVLLALLCLVSFAKNGKIKHILWMAVVLGLGVLTKGPVAWLYVIFPILTGRLWAPVEIKPSKWYLGCISALILSTIPVLIWLIPVLSQSSDKFAYWLIWEQTFGRISGSFKSSHARPVWFYLPLIPLFFMPWLFSPHSGKGLKK